MLAVAGVLGDEGLAIEVFLDLRPVGSGDGIADEKDARQRARGILAGFERGLDHLGDFRREVADVVDVERLGFALAAALGVEVVDDHAVLLHHLGGDGVVSVHHLTADVARLGADKDGRGVRPDQGGFGLLEARNDGAQVFLVILDRCADDSAFFGSCALAVFRGESRLIPDAVVEMNDIPAAIQIEPAAAGGREEIVAERARSAGEPGGMLHGEADDQDGFFKGFADDMAEHVIDADTEAERVGGIGGDLQQAAGGAGVVRKRVGIVYGDVIAFRRLF